MELVDLLFDVDLGVEIEHGVIKHLCPEIMDFGLHQVLHELFCIV